jgi:hypothetical protein
MTGLSQETLLMFLKIAIVPVMLLSILWRNRREKRRRADTAAEEQAARNASARREVIDLRSAEIATLQAALDSVTSGACLVSLRNEPVTEPALRSALATALMDADRFDDAAGVIGGADQSCDPDVVICAARLELHRGDETEAISRLSQAADLKLAALRQASRGVRLHLAELLAQSLSDALPPLTLQNTRLSGLGPLDCLILSGRDAEARSLLEELLPLLQRAIAESAGDPEGRAGPLPRQAAEAALSRLAAYRDRHFTPTDA